MKTPKLKCYYAHSLHLYNTKQEKRDIWLLEQLGYEVFNPNSPEHQRPYEDQGMEYFVKLVRFCDIIAFRAYPDGSIPAGAHKEIMSALEDNKPILEIPWGLKRRGLSVEDTREWLHELGER
jgi:hypothetical protein